MTLSPEPSASANRGYTFTIESEPDPQSQDEISAFLTEHWGEPNIVSRGKVTDASSLPRVIARDTDGFLVGLATYHLGENESCELVSIDATIQSIGIGSGLLNRVERIAKEAGCHTIWLITTNNNTAAQEFYTHKGYKRVAIHKNALERSRQLKPGIPTHDENGVPISDEWEYQKNLV